MSITTRSSKPQSFEKRLADIQAMKPGDEAVKELAKIAAQDPYEEMRLCALETAAQHLRAVALKWRGPKWSPDLTDLLTAYLDLLCSQLTVGQVRPPFDFRLKVEGLILEALAKAPFFVLRPAEELREEDFSPFQCILACSQALPKWGATPNPRPFYEIFDAFWRKFLRPGVLEISPVTLMEPVGPDGQLLEIAGQTRNLLDQICTWVAERRENDDLLVQVRVYGLGKTREVVSRRFWDMICRCSVEVGSKEDAGAFLEDPVDWALANASQHLSNRLFTAYHALAARQINGQRISARRVPEWVKETKTWAELSLRAGRES